MTKCNHEWVHLINIQLEERLISQAGGGYEAHDLRGCKKCGSILKGKWEVASAFILWGMDMANREYWRAIARFTGLTGK